MYGYELGNEPGCYMPEFNISAADAVLDFAILTRVINEVYADAPKGLTKPLVMGPDVGGCAHADFLAPILAAGLKVDVITMHHYVIGGAFHTGLAIGTADMVKFALSNFTQDQFKGYNDVKKKYASLGKPDAELWVGEGGKPLFLADFSRHI